MAWYEEFFGEDYMRFHLLGDGKYERAQGECDFVVSALDLQPGARRERSFALRTYTHPEFVGMLRRSGLVWVRTYGDFDGLEYGETSPRMIVLARKPEDLS